METLTISKADKNGVPSGTPFVFEAAVVYGESFHHTRPSQRTNRVKSGALVTYDSPITIVDGVLSIKYMEESTKTALEAFIVNELGFNNSYFNISSSVVDVTLPLTDFGMGVGVAVKACKLSADKATTKGFFSPVPPGIYDVNIPYTFVVEAQ